MREIVCRGKRSNGEWVAGRIIADDVILPRGQTFTTGERNEFKPVEDIYCFKVNLETVGQFTGVNDRNGTKVFEGDIICYDNLFLGVVEWSSEHCGFYVKGVNHNDYDYLGNFYSRLCEVVGNIYDNPELLRGARK